MHVHYTLCVVAPGAMASLAEGREVVGGSSGNEACKDEASQGLVAGTPLSSSTLLLRLWPFLRDDAASLGIGSVALVASSFSNAMTPQILRALIDGAPSGGSEAMRGTVQRAVGMFAAGALASYIRTRTAGAVAARVARRMRTELFHALLQQEMAFFDAEKTAALVDALLQDVDTCAKVMISSAMNLLRYTSSVVCGTVMVAQISSRATLRFTGMTLAVVPVVAMFSAKQWKGLRRERSKDDALRVDTTAFVLERMSGIQTVRTFAREDHEVSRFTSIAEEAYRMAARVARAEAALYGTLDMMLKSAAIGLIAYGSSLVHAGQLSAGSLTQFTISAGLAGAGLAGFSRVFAADWQNPARRILAYMERKPLLRLTGGSTKARLLGDIRFENVDFGYASRARNRGETSADVAVGPTVRGVNLELRSGEIVALTGPSGCGKTTLGRLLLQLYRPTGGTIYFDGIASESYDPSWLRSQIGVVEQDAALFSGSVRDNIRYGRLDADDAAIEVAARLAHAHDFISELPEGYDTPVGERGALLSGGQRQRVAIARALVRDPPILLLDEATASLDQAAEAQVHAALREAMSGRTVLVIAHNEANFSFAGRVEVFAPAVGNSGFTLTATGIR